MSTGKSILRDRFDAYRRTLTISSHARRSKQITDRVIVLPEVVSASTVHVYWPLVERREVDTRPLIRALDDQQKQIVMPVIDTYGMQAGGVARMQHARYSGQAGLQINRWGIHQPTSDHLVPVSELDAVLVPALGAGRSGHRIGYGYGYYDEFLARTTAPKIALVYNECLVDCVPAESHDVPMDVIVTERTVLRPNSTGDEGKQG